MKPWKQSVSQSSIFISVIALLFQTIEFVDCKTVGFFLNKISKDLLFDCSRVLENAKIRTVLQSIEFANRPVPEKFCIFRIILPCMAFITPRYLSPVPRSPERLRLWSPFGRGHTQTKKRRNACIFWVPQLKQARLISYGIGTLYRSR